MPTRLTRPILITYPVAALVMAPLLALVAPGGTTEPPPGTEPEDSGFVVVWEDPGLDDAFLVITPDRSNDTGFVPAAGSPGVVVEASPPDFNRDRAP